MSVEFRCERCGRLISAEPEARQVICPGCRRRVGVPAALAAMPRPQVGSDRSETPPQQEPLIEEAPERSEPASAMTAVAGALPWVMSLFFHIGVFLIMLFIVLLAMPEEAEQVTVTGAVYRQQTDLLRKSGLSDRISELNSKQATAKEWSRDTSNTTVAGTDTGTTPKTLRVLGRGGGSAGSIGRQTFAVGGTQGGGFFDTRFGNVQNIVFVIDRSGSMAYTFDQVRYELLRSIAQMTEQQDFHVIFFAEGRPQENRPRRLVPATHDNKIEIAGFLETLVAEGSTSPVQALERAFEVLQHPREGRQGKVIYLLTDAVFDDNEQLMELIRNRNAGKKIIINTMLYGNRPPQAEKVMRRIAAENGGRYKYIPENQ